MINNGFDPDDIKEITSRKKKKFHMSNADFKELGRNALLGTVDVAISCAATAIVVASNLPEREKSNNLDEVYEPLSSDGWKDGPQGYGYYRNGIKD